MNFTEYRNKSLKKLWRHCCEKTSVLRLKNFSTWQMDDICAVNWKNENPIDVCVNALHDYVGELIRKTY